LRLGRQLGPLSLLEGARRTGQTFADPDIYPRGSQSAAARGLEQQDMKFAGNPSGDPRLNRSKVVRLEFVPTGPEIFGGGRVGDPHIHTQKPRRAALRAPGDDVIEPAFGRPNTIAQRGSFVF
jgi:hypothetical protein